MPDDQVVLFMVSQTMASPEETTGRRPYRRSPRPCLTWSEVGAGRT